MVAVKVGYSFCLFNVFELRNANLERTGVQVKVNGCLYNLFKGIGTTSRKRTHKIDKF